MNEAINTNEVKRRIQCCIDTKECILCPFFKIGCDKSTFAKLMRKAVQQLEDHIRDLTKMMPTWISVEERLPERHGQLCVGLYNHHGADKPMLFPHLFTWHAYGDNGYVNGSHFSDEGLYGLKVFYWMPLPKVPEEGTK